MILAFAFSLTADGSPGSYNHWLADLIARHLNQVLDQSIELPVVAVQWEIADALEESFPDLLIALETEQRLIVASPPRFKAGEVNEEQVANCLLETGAQGKALWQCIIETGKADDSLLDKMNRLLDQASLFREFQTVNIDNLFRPQGELFTENREMPKSSEYSDGLRRYQRVRVNRLLIESIANNTEVIAQGNYLSTPGVIDSVFDQLELVPPEVQLVAHPLHAPRCQLHIEEALNDRHTDAKVGLDLLEGSVGWDSSSAQVWCRSLQNWQQYEATVRSMMNARSKH